ncbi:hypothetical protein [Brevirhabdus sp.]|uniref:hypothetical protein n=1 Tax=Brevirhabdus sp. TaxID=2004514 RepID=UPI004058042A
MRLSRARPSDPALPETAPPETRRSETRLSATRLGLGTVGAVAGLSLWLLIEWMPGVLGPSRLLLWLSAFAAIFFGALLTLAGPLRLWLAARQALWLAVVSSLLLTWGSLRFASIEDFTDAGHPMVAFVLLSALSLPFLIVQGRDGGWTGGAGDRAVYESLYDQAWALVVRVGAALLFTGFFWLVYFLSDALLGLVGLTVLDRLTDRAWFVATVSGTVLGLALAVVQELAGAQSPRLLLRLLRLLLPVVLLVTLVFLVAVPLRGLGDAFGDLSAGATLLSMGLGAAALITITLDKGPTFQSKTRIMSYSARALALALVPLAGFGCYAVVLRVAQHGWSPSRVAAALSGLVVLGYGLSYAQAVLRGGDWAARIRRANVVLALAVIALAGVWLTPLLNAERISARSQAARYLSGAVNAERLDVEALALRWGRPGRAALEDLRAREDLPGHDRLSQRIELAYSRARRPKLSAMAPDAAPDAAPEDRAEARATLRARLLVLPRGSVLPPDLLDDLATPLLADWARACARPSFAAAPSTGSPGPAADGSTARGAQGGCLAVVADFVPGWPGPEALFVTRGPDGMAVPQVVGRGVDGRYRARGGLRHPNGDPVRRFDDAALRALFAGEASLPQIPLTGLAAGGESFMILP